MSKIILCADFTLEGIMVGKKFAWFGIVAFSIFLALGTLFGVNSSVHHVIEIQADREARSWARYLIENISDMEALLESGKPTQKQVDLIQAAEKIGSVFRFKLFDQAGRLVLISNEVTSGSELLDGTHSLTAQQVIKSGSSDITLKDGNDVPNRPPVFVEAYVPILTPQSGIIGAVEVYIDQTEISALLHKVFGVLSVVLACLFGLLFGAPSLALVTKHTQEKRARAEIDFLAEFDPLTQVRNRAGFHQLLKSRRETGDVDWQNAAFIAIDIDDFNHINDMHGYGAGDICLKQVAQRLANVKGESDLLARFGGDDFVMVVFGQSKATLEELLKGLRVSLSQPYHANHTSVSCGVSIGVCWQPNSSEPTEVRLQRADMALSQAKHDGKGQIRHFSDQLEQRISRQRVVEAAVRTGLSEERFDLHFQPLIDAKDGKCTGFEALLRLNDKAGQRISPVEFVPVAEATGAIVDIGNWVIDKSIELAATWPKNLSVSVNLSAKQFETGTLVSVVQDALNRHGVEPKRLELEVTESLLIMNEKSIEAQIINLKNIGVRISMDDFGSGYSNLGYLWKFNFDKIKLDRSFISAMEIDPSKTREIIETVVMLGHRLGMSVTAEGVETESQAELLTSLSCDYLQGYHFSRPMDVQQLSGFLLKNFQASSCLEDRSEPIKQLSCIA